MTNLEEEEESALGQEDRVEDGFAHLQGWIDGGTPLTFKHIASLYDNKTVIVDPVASQPIKLVPLDQVEEHMLHITTNEI